MNYDKKKKKQNNKNQKCLLGLKKNKTDGMMQFKRGAKADGNQSGQCNLANSHIFRTKSEIPKRRGGMVGIEKKKEESCRSAFLAHWKERD